MHQNIYSSKNILNFLITLLLLTLYCFDVSANIEPAKFKHLKKFYEVLSLIDKQYVEEPDQKKITDASIIALTSALDPHSSYLTKEDMQDFLTEIDGQFGGVGIEMTQEDGYIKVIAPIDDLAADKAGIRSGDYIIAVNDEQVQELGFYRAAKNIRGTAGTKVKLKILRQGVSHPLEMTLIRSIVQIKSVKHNIDNNIGYLRISTFNKNTTKELKKSFDELNKSTKLEGIILDLRNNPGGLLDQSIKVSEFFINSGKIVSIKGRDPSNNQVFTSNTFAEKAPNLNIVVLINSGTASAAEIVSGALQDNKRAIIIGTKSFGKGSVQGLIKLSDGSGIKLTTAKYYTPNDTCIQAQGIMPDIIVENAQIEYPNQNSENKKLFEKSLPNHLKNNSAEIYQNSNKQDSNIAVKLSIPSDMYKKDYQYSKAFDILKSLDVVAKKGINKN